MINALIGTKQAMTHFYTPAGRWVPVTRLALGPCVVTQVKTKETDGYQAVQIAFGERKRQSAALSGHLKKSQVTGAVKILREVPVESQVPEIGTQIKVNDVFQVGDVVAVTGWTKGRGFSGVVKRWGFAGGPKTHGQSDRHRGPGSIGQGTTPGRVHKGKKMAGKYGPDRKTIKNLAVVKVNSDQNELWVKGAVAGYKSSPVIVTIQKRKPQPATGDTNEA